MMKKQPAQPLTYYFVVLLILPILLVGCALRGKAAEGTRTGPGRDALAATNRDNAEQGPRRLLVATTTSTDDSGLLEHILPDFVAKYNVTVDVIAVGTGQALQLGRDGNADVLLVHARALEDEFMQSGYGIRREDVMVNNFVVVGPDDDPANIRGLASVVDAFEQIANEEAPFISRGDESGTHAREREIWFALGSEPVGDWYVSAGHGMGAVLTMADEQRAYTLSDRATYEVRSQEGLALEILVEGDAMLLNPYGVIVVKAVNGDGSSQDLAQSFVDWLISLPVQEKIGQYGAETFATPLFTPNSEQWHAAHAGDH